MTPVTTREQLLAILQQPWPVALAEGLFARAPEVDCYVAAQTLDQVLRLHCGPTALRWRDGQVRCDANAAARARLSACVWRDAEGTPLFSGDEAQALAHLPAGVLDKLLLAADQASGYQATPASDTSQGISLAQRYAAAGQWVEGLLPMAPDAGLYVTGYDFAALAAAESAATLTVPGGETRVELLSYPGLVAASLRCGPGPDAAPLVDDELARSLPYGTCRAVVELADALSEMGGPAVAVRFLDQRTGPQPDGALPVAAEAHRSPAE